MVPRSATKPIEPSIDPAQTTWTAKGRMPSPTQPDADSMKSVSVQKPTVSEKQSKVSQSGLSWVKRREHHWGEDRTPPQVDRIKEAAEPEWSTDAKSGESTGENLIFAEESQGRETHRMGLLPLAPPPVNSAMLPSGLPSGLPSSPSSGMPFEELGGWQGAAILDVHDVSDAAQVLTSEDAAAETNTQRFHLASKVSRQIIGQLDQSQSNPVGPLQASAGWDWIGKQLSDHLHRSQRLAGRGVFLSAREECNLALLLLARHLDHISNGFQCEPGFHSAQTALRESMDFTAFHQTTDESILKQIVHSHETPILKQSHLGQVSPVTLAEHYLQYAEEQIIAASQQHPWFSDILYQLGRTLQSEADMVSSPASDHLRGQAILYYRAALAIVPANALAANQVGFLLLQQDRPSEALQYLVAAVNAAPNVPSLQNLVEASRRLGDRPMEQWSLQALAAIQNRQPSGGPMPSIELLNNSAFVAISPMTAGPRTMPTPLTASAPHATLPDSIDPAAAHTLRVPSVSR